MKVQQEVISQAERNRRELAARQRRKAAIGIADNVLRRLWYAINNKQVVGNELSLLNEIKEARGALAEWRPESE